MVEQDFLSRYRAEIVGELDALVSAGGELPLYRMMRYHLGLAETPGERPPEVAGKLVRPALCLFCCHLVGGDYRRALPAAAALELVHNFSLVHDDVEDQSETRHHGETVWRRWGTAQAINTGDGLWALAHLAMHRLSEQGTEPETVLLAMKLLDQAGLWLSEGQQQDLTFEERAEVSEEEYLRMARGKTGAIMGAAAAIGVLLGGAASPVVYAFRLSGEKLGQAFQVQDDVLGIWGEESEMGKSVEDDLRRRKKSIPLVYALRHAAEAERGRLREIFATPGVGPAEAAEVRQILERVGARQRCEALAQRLVEETLRAVEAVGIPEHLQDQLRAFAEYVVTRRR